MRLGAPVFGCKTPEEWAATHIRKGFGAAYCPVSEKDDDGRISDYIAAAKAHDIVIAEVGIWNNMLDRDAAAREANITRAIERLKFADRVGARCCVNIAGSLSPRWDGPHPDNLTRETFDAIVHTAQRIIDTAAPERTYFVLEPMPWVYPYDVKTYLQLIEAIGRERFAVHIDICNWMNGVLPLYSNSSIIRETFETLAPYIKCVHAKDSVISGELTTHVSEAIPGRGLIDYGELLRQCNALGDVPVLAEHLSTEAEYDEATGFIHARAKELGLAFVSAR